MGILHLEGFGYRGGAAGLALEYTLGGSGTATDSTMSARRPGCFAVDATDVSIKKLISAPTVHSSGYVQIVIGFAMQWTTGAAGDFCQVLDADGSTVHISAHVSAAGELSIYRGDSATGTLLDTGSTLSSGIPVYISLIVAIHDTLGSAIIARDGVTDCEDSSGDTQNGGTASVGGVILYGPANGCLFTDWYIIDLLDGVYPSSVIGGLGPRIDCYLPRTQADWSDFTASGSETYLGIEMVDETSPDGDTTYKSSSTAGHRHFFRFGPMDHDPSSVLMTRVIVTARKDDSGDRSIKLGYVSEATVELAFSGTTTDDAQALTTSYDAYDWYDEARVFTSQTLFNNSSFGVEVV